MRKHNVNQWQFSIETKHSLPFSLMLIVDIHLRGGGFQDRRVVLLLLTNDNLLILLQKFLLEHFMTSTATSDYLSTYTLKTLQARP